MDFSLKSATADPTGGQLLSEGDISLNPKEMIFMREQISFEEVIRSQFDAMIKLVVSRCVRKYERSLNRLAKHEVVFSNIPDFDFENVGTIDYNHAVSDYFDNDEFSDFGITDEQLIVALKTLTDKQKSIISIC